MQSVLWMPVTLFVLALVAATLTLVALHLSHKLNWSHRCPTLGLALSIAYIVALPDVMLLVYTTPVSPTPRHYAWFGIAAATLAMVILTTRAYIEKTKVVQRWQLRSKRAERRSTGRRHSDSFV